MFTRRGFAGVLALPLMGFANKLAPEIWSGTTIAKAERGSILVGKQHVRLRNRAKPREVVMLSESNDNQKFMLWLVLPLQHEGDFQYLKLGTEWWSSHGTGRDDKQSNTTFHFDRATARRIADAFGIAMHERTKLDGGLRYSWRFPAKAGTDKTAPIPVVMRVENAGKTTVGISIGGRQRGPRDNRFSFVIQRNGKPVTIKEAHDFGGLMTYKELKPGEHTEVTCPDLRAWADLDLPGYYTIEARYDAELVKDGKMPTTAVERANVWEASAPGQGSILVQ